VNKTKIEVGNRVEFIDKDRIPRKGEVVEVNGCNINIRSGRLLKRTFTVRARFVRQVE